MMNGMGMMGLGGGMLTGLHQVMASISYFTELLGMSTESIGYLFGSAVGFLDTATHVVRQLKALNGKQEEEDEEDRGKEMYMDENGQMIERDEEGNERLITQEELLLREEKKHKREKKKLLIWIARA